MTNLIHKDLIKHGMALDMVRRLNALGMTAAFTRRAVRMKPVLEGGMPGIAYQYVLTAAHNGAVVTNWMSGAGDKEPAPHLESMRPMFDEWIREYVEVEVTEK